MKRLLPGLVLALCAALTALPAAAHKPSDSYLNLDVSGQHVDGRWDIALRDLEYAIGLDRNGDAAISWGELKRRRDAVFAYALSRLSLGRTTDCDLQPGELRVTEHVDGAYAVLGFSANCTDDSAPLRVGYRLLFDIDPSHRGLLRLDTPAGTRTAVFSPQRSVQHLDAQTAGTGAALVQYFIEGVHHIWIGTDHVLFLITLLLPAVLLRTDSRWQPRPRAGPAIIEVTKLVTAFTVAHSITLALAVLGVVDLPSRLVESVIALSVLAMALNNLVPVVPEGRWVLVFVFGLIHGFGFASVLGELGLPAGALAVSLLGFNLGVEAGQLAIVAVALPAALLLRGTAFYRIVVLQAGSAIIAAIAALWLVQRVFAI